MRKDIVGGLAVLVLAGCPIKSNSPGSNNAPQENVSLVPEKSKVKYLPIPMRQRMFSLEYTTSSLNEIKISFTKDQREMLLPYAPVSFKVFGDSVEKKYDAFFGDPTQLPLEDGLASAKRSVPYSLAGSLLEVYGVRRSSKKAITGKKVIQYGEPITIYSQILPFKSGNIPSLERKVGIFEADDASGLMLVNGYLDGAKYEVELNGRRHKLPNFPNTLLLPNEKSARGLFRVYKIVPTYDFVEKEESRLVYVEMLP